MGTMIIRCVVILPGTKNRNFLIFNFYRNAVAIFNIITTSYNVPFSRHLIVII